MRVILSDEGKNLDDFGCSRNIPDEEILDKVYQMTGHIPPFGEKYWELHFEDYLQALRGTRTRLALGVKTRKHLNEKNSWQYLIKNIDAILEQIPELDKGDKHALDVTPKSLLLSMKGNSTDVQRRLVVKMLCSVGTGITYATICCGIIAILQDELSMYCVYKFCVDGALRLDRKHWLDAKKAWSKGVMRSNFVPGLGCVDGLTKARAIHPFRATGRAEFNSDIPEEVEKCVDKDRFTWISLFGEDNSQRYYEVLEKEIDDDIAQFTTTLSNLQPYTLSEFIDRAPEWLAAGSDPLHPLWTFGKDGYETADTNKRISWLWGAMDFIKQVRDDVKPFLAVSDSEKNELDKARILLAACVINYIISTHVYNKFDDKMSKAGYSISAEPWKRTALHTYYVKRCRDLDSWLHAKDWPDFNSLHVPSVLSALPLALGKHGNRGVAPSIRDDWLKSISFEIQAQHNAYWIHSRYKDIEWSGKGFETEEMKRVKRLLVDSVLKSKYPDTDDAVERLDSKVKNILERPVTAVNKRLCSGVPPTTTTNNAARRGYNRTAYKNSKEIGLDVVPMKRMDGSGDDALEEHPTISNLLLFKVMMEAQGHEFKENANYVSRRETNVLQNIIDAFGVRGMPGRSLGTFVLKDIKARRAPLLRTKLVNRFTTIEEVYRRGCSVTCVDALIGTTGRDWSDPPDTHDRAGNPVHIDWERLYKLGRYEGGVSNLCFLKRAPMVSGKYTVDVGDPSTNPINESAAPTDAAGRFAATILRGLREQNPINHDRLAEAVRTGVIRSSICLSWDGHVVKVDTSK